MLAARSYNVTVTAQSRGAPARLDELWNNTGSARDENGRRILEARAAAIPAQPGPASIGIRRGRRAPIFPRGVQIG